MRYLIIFLAGWSIPGYAQTLDRQVIGSYGGQSNTVEGNLLLQNVGEPVTATGITGTFMLNQGFEQPDSIKSGSVGYIQYEIFNQITVYPNPGRSVMNVRIRSTQRTDVLITLYDLNGKKLMEKTVYIDHSEPVESEFETESLAKGTYFVRFFNDKQVMLHSTQWVKY